MPIAANTLSSSVSDVQAVCSVARLIGQYDLKTGTSLRPLMPPFALMSSKKIWYACCWSGSTESTSCSMHEKSIIMTPTLICVALTPVPSEVSFGVVVLVDAAGAPAL